MQVDSAQCDDLAANISIISPRLRSAPIARRQACYVPNHYRKGRVFDPMLGPTDVPGLWLAAGHTVWGIQNGPATGFLMARYLLNDGGDPREDEVGAKALRRLEPRKWFKV